MSPGQKQQGAGVEAGVSQVAEESEGWYRLRTVANQWSSDEDTATRHAVQDLRNKLVSWCVRAINVCT